MPDMRHSPPAPRANAAPQSIVQSSTAANNPVVKRLSIYGPEITPRRLTRQVLRRGKRLKGEARGSPVLLPRYPLPPLPLLEFSHQHQHADGDEGDGRRALYPFEREVVAERAADEDAERRDARERERRRDEDRPGLLSLGRHRHRRELRLVAHLRQEYRPERCQKHAPVHQFTPRMNCLVERVGVTLTRRRGGLRRARRATRRSLRVRHSEFIASILATPRASSARVSGAFGLNCVVALISPFSTATCT